MISTITVDMSLVQLLKQSICGGGERLSRHGRIETLGYVIGLRNLEAGIAWRLDYDEKKAHT